MSHAVAVRRRRAAVAAAAVVLVIAAAVVAATGAFDGSGPPATGAAAFAPKDTLVYVHVSTDTGRGAVGDAQDLLGRFDSYERIRDSILQNLAGQQARAEDVEPWLGDEAALALVDAGQATAGSLVIVKVTDAAKARAFLDRNPRRSARREYKGDRIDEFGTVNVAFKDGYLLIGQSLTVQGALDRANGRGDTLADDATFERATAKLPDDRVADAYVTSAGLRRLLVPQGGVLGTVAAMLDQPALRGMALSAEATDPGVRLTTHAILDPAEHKQAGVLKTFTPALLGAVPEDAMAYLGVTGISRSLGNLLAAAAGGANAGGVGPVLQRLQRALSKQAGGGLEQNLLALLRGEVALVLVKATPAPTLALVTKVKDEDATASLLRRLQEPLAELLTPKGGEAPEWHGQTLTTPSGAQLSYAVAGGRLIVGTSEQAVRHIRDARASLKDAKRFETAISRSENVTSLGFLDFSQLLELGEQTGLNESRAYLAARQDLHRIRAIGISSHGGEGETTAEILLSIR